MVIGRREATLDQSNKIDQHIGEKKSLQVLFATMFWIGKNGLHVYIFFIFRTSLIG